MSKLFVIPEFELLRIIKAGLKYIEEDYQAHVDAGTEEDSYLYIICNKQEIERYRYLEQAKSVLFRDSDDIRKLNVDVMYNMNFEKVPSIYVTLSGEQHGENNLSVEQETEPVYNTDGTEYRELFTRRKNATYSIYIVSDNSNEACLLYYIIDCLLLSTTVHLNLLGLYNLTQGGQDIQLDSDKIPKNMFIKTLLIGMQYSRSAPSLHTSPVFTDILFKGRPTDSIE